MNPAMKKIFLILTLSFSVAFLSVRSVHAQVLSLDSIVGFPDTVENNMTVTMTLLISNSGGIVYNSDLAILMNTLGGDTLADTIYYNGQYTLSGNTFGDTVSINYTFDAADYDAGDNIVVVWPVSAQLPIAVVTDSLTFDVWFNNVGIGENQSLQSIRLYPNPSSENISLFTSHPEKVEHVRVVDLIGNVLKVVEGPVTRFSIAFLPRGIYFVEVRNKDGSCTVRKFLKQ
jgi:hypothetical protein